jgi:Domain of unknown function (DUF4406)
MKLYVAGPMQNHPRYNFPAFQEATAVLRRLGFEVISPEEKDRQRDPAAWERAWNSPDGVWKPEETGGLTWAQILSQDIILVADVVDGLALLPGWEKSSGARLEVFTALLRKKLFGLYFPESEAIQFVDAEQVREKLIRNMP